MKTLLYAIIAIIVPISAFAADPSPTPTAPDRLTSALADMVSKSVQVAGDTKDFMVSQLPDVIQQLLR